MAFSHGKNTKVLYDSGDLTTYLNEASAANTVDTAETSTFNSGDAKTYVVGLVDGTVSLSGIYDAEPGAADPKKVDDLLSAALGNGDELAMVLPAGDGGGVGARALFFKSEATSYEITSPIGDVVAVSIELQADGGINFGTYLREAVSGAGYEQIAAAATDTSAVVDNAAATSDGGVAQVQVPVNSLNNGLVVKIQDSPDNITWADRITFATVAAGTRASEQLEVTGSVGRYIRSSVSASAATAGSAQVAVAFRRR